MKKVFLGVVIIVFAVFLFSVSVKAEVAVTGIWKTVADEGPNKGKDTSHVEIFEKNGVYFGKITKLLTKPQDTICDKCVGDLKNKPVVGLVNLQDMKKTGSVDDELGTEYAGGTIMDPNSGKTYKCKMWAKDNVLSVRGYIAFIYRTQKWFRVK